MASNALLRWGYDRVWDKWPVMLVPLVQKFRRLNGYTPNLVRPRTLNEKTLYRMLFDRRTILPVFAGKLESRDYVRRRMGDAILIPLIGVVRRPTDIGTISLPGTFIMKASHGSGMVHIHRGGSLDLGRLERLCRDWLATDRAKYGREWVYKHTERAVVIEELQLDAKGELPCDYKFYCYDGEPRFINVFADRQTGLTRDTFDPDWNDIPGLDSPDKQVVRPARPPHLSEMLEVARTLSSGIDFVRVDLYDLPDGVRFGELTMTPKGGAMQFASRDQDALFGAPWTLDLAGDPTCRAPRSASD